MAREPVEYLISKTSHWPLKQRRRFSRAAFEREPSGARYAVGRDARASLQLAPHREGAQPSRLRWGGVDPLRRRRHGRRIFGEPIDAP